MPTRGLKAYVGPKSFGRVKTYTVTNAIAFHALYLPYPPGALLFWHKPNAGGVLLLPGVDYVVSGPSFVLGSNINIAVGDVIAVIG